jgi:Big-like domain-containing protein
VHRPAPFPALAAFAALAGAACANMGEPPGGPPDTTPPRVIAVRPESGAVVATLKGAAVVQFDDVIDEMASGGSASASGGGPTGIGRYVLLSPVAGEVRVGWHRSSISVEPKEGWKPGRVYHLQLLPGITNLRRGVRKEGQTIIFSTGPAIPAARLTGTAVLWVEQRTLVQNGLIRAVPLPQTDSAAYLATTDSAGRFRLEAIPPGRYLVYALQDANGNRRRDRREAYDSTVVTVDSTAAVTLWAFVHDTVGPRGRTAEPLDSLTFRVTFTQPLDPADVVDTSRVRLVALPDSSRVAVAAVFTPAAFDSLSARERAAADSVRRAADTTAKHDTSTRGAAPPALAAAQRAPAARAGGAGASPDSATRADTSGLKRLLAQRPVPTDHLIIRVRAPLTPNSRYHLLLRRARNLAGVVSDAQAVLTVPKPPPPPKPAARDSTRARRDSTRP